MMATCTSVCAVCDLRHQTSTSTHWCIECEEPLCSDCTDHHNVFKAARSHKTIPISDYQLLPTVETKIKQHCNYHNELYQLYCIKHDYPICNKCVKDHGKCGQILPLDEIVKDIKTSESFVDLEQSLDDLSSNINKIREDRESNIESITDQKQKITAQVCLFKKQVIQHVEILEEEFIKELDQIEFECCDPIHSVVSSLQDTANEINKLKSEIENTKKYPSNLHTFLSMREIQKKTSEYEKNLQAGIENEYNETTYLELAIDTKIQDILNVDRYGSINVKNSPSSNLDLKRRKDRQAQIVLPKTMNLINKIKLELKQKLNTACDRPYGCCLNSKGEFMFSNHEGIIQKIVKINAKGRVVYTIPLTKPYCAFDIASLDDYTVAVSSGLAKRSGISIVDLIKKTVKWFIGLPGDPYGITYDGKSLICCVKGKDLHVISCTDYSITTIPNTVSSERSYVSTHDDKIFFTNRDKNIVTCCLYSGAHVWEFKDESILEIPRGITVDNKGNVFVAGYYGLVVISYDGKHGKELSDREIDVVAPFYDKARSQLLVIYWQASVGVYNVTYF